MVGAAYPSHAGAEETKLASVTLPKPQGSDQVIPACKTDLRLSGAVYDARHPERSFALVQFRKNERAGVVRVGSSLGAFQLVAIEPRGVLLSNAEGHCWLRLVGDPAARARPAPPPPRRAKAKRSPKQKKKSEVVVIGRR